MLYQEFVDELKNYLEVYEKGLKKQANKVIDHTVILLKDSDSDVVN